MNLKQQLKSKTIRFNTAMAVIDLGIVNAVLLQDMLTIKQFAFTLFGLKVLQTLGNMYLRNKTVEAIGDKK